MEEAANSSMMNRTTNVTVANQTFPPNDTGVINHCSNVFPKAAKYYRDLHDNPVEIVFIVLGTGLTVSTLGLYVTELLSKHFRYPEAGKRLKTLILLGLYPMTSFMSLFALLVPRSTFLVDLIASFYLSLCIYVFMTILIQYYGGTNKMLCILSQTRLSLQTPPCCCCCCCLPTIKLTRRNLYIIKALIGQVAVLQPLLLFAKAVVWSDDSAGFAESGSASPFVAVNVLSGISTLLSVYGLMISVRASQEMLEKHRIRAKYTLLQLVLLFTNLQNAIFGIFSRFDLPPCYKGSGSKVRGSVYHHMMVVAEMLLLAVVARKIYRKSESRMLVMTQVKVNHQKYSTVDSTDEQAVSMPSSDTRADLIQNMQKDDIIQTIAEKESNSV